MAELQLIGALIQAASSVWTLYKFLSDIPKAGKNTIEILETVETVNNVLQQLQDSLHMRASCALQRHFPENEAATLLSIERATRNVKTTVDNIIRSIYGEDDPKYPSKTKKVLRKTWHALRPEEIANFKKQLHLDLTTLHVSQDSLKLYQFDSIRLDLRSNHIELIEHIHQIRDFIIRDVLEHLSQAEDARQTSATYSTRSPSSGSNSSLFSSLSHRVYPKEIDIDGSKQSTTNAEQVLERLTPEYNVDFSSTETFQTALPHAQASEATASDSPVSLEYQASNTADGRVMPVDAGATGVLPPITAESMRSGSSPYLESSEERAGNAVCDNIGTIEAPRSRTTSDFASLTSTIEQNAAGINRRDSHGWAALHYAAARGDADEVRRLAGVEACIDLRVARADDAEHSDNALSLAISNEHVDVVKELLDREANVLTLFDDNTSLLHKAVQSDSVECISMLLATNNAKRLVDLQNSYDETALHVCINKSWPDGVVALLTCANPANTSLPDMHERTPLHVVLNQPAEDNKKAQAIFDLLWSAQPEGARPLLTTHQQSSLDSHLKRQRKASGARRRSSARR